MAASSKPKLYSLDISADRLGRAEPIKLLLVYTGTEFEDISFTKEEWEAKFKAESPFGMAPFYEECDEKGKPREKLGGSMAIMRYLGKKYDLGGKGTMEDGQLAACADALIEVIPPIFKFKEEYAAIEEEKKKVEAWAKFSKTITTNLLFIHVQLKAEDSFVVGRTTWPDIVLYYIVRFISTENFLMREVLLHLEKIKATFDRISEDERIKAYTDRFYPRIPTPPPEEEKEVRQVTLDGTIVIVKKAADGTITKIPVERVAAGDTTTAVPADKVAAGDTTTAVPADKADPAP